MCRTEALKMTDMKIADHQNVQALMDGREIDGPNVQT